MRIYFLSLSLLSVSRDRSVARHKKRERRKGVIKKTPAAVGGMMGRKGKEKRVPPPLFSKHTADSERRREKEKKKGESLRRVIRSEKHLPGTKWKYTHKKRNRRIVVVFSPSILRRIYCRSRYCLPFLKNSSMKNHRWGSPPNEPGQ